MLEPSHPSIYDKIGEQYQSTREPDQRIGKIIREAIGSAKTVCNIGAGTGAYEPLDLKVTAVEPSKLMIQKRRNDFPVVQGVAENLPFQDNSFDVSLATLTVHHWTDAEQGLSEMKRVSRRQVILTFDTEVVADFWLVRDYLPELNRLDQERLIPLSTFGENLNVSSIIEVPVPADCTDGFQAAFWKRPNRYLDANVRASISSFAQLDKSVVADGLAKLKNDIATGTWQERYQSLLSLNELDCGYRMVVAENQSD